MLIGLLAVAACHTQDDAKVLHAEGLGQAPVVVLAEIKRANVPVYVQAMGTATAFYSTLVRPQVDGKLEAVYFKEGQTVRKGDVLAQIDPRPFEIALAQAEGQLLRDEATLHVNHLDLNRQIDLRSKDLVSQQSVDAQQALTYQTHGQVLIDKAQVDNAKLQLSYARITAPISGILGIRMIDPGNILHASDTNGLVMLTQINPIAVIFGLPEDYLPMIQQRMGQHVVANIDALDIEIMNRQGKKYALRGKVQVLDNQINQATANMRLKAIVDNPNHDLWPNQFVKVSLHLNTLENVLQGPASLVQRGPEGTFAYVLQADNTVRVQRIEIQQVMGETVVLHQGLQVGDRVVVEGQYQLHDGSHVTVHQEKSINLPSQNNDLNKKSMPP